ncbi:hypothetical protein C9374_010869 [Naegleria lovaniensis]|uniref:Uncharacterized protein n=1 Tax=Naegleria lovaniensis TaxID=51637 RepID=A0AA88KF73_NAELO|nr:uncharacterized protein C9374_010869 [Naegleria lovaniensis]KAG2374299.1 hypothetical protein C9374_010869 [Naegleria lovaniensis]
MVNKPLRTCSNSSCCPHEHKRHYVNSPLLKTQKGIRKTGKTTISMTTRPRGRRGFSSQDHDCWERGFFHDAREGHSQQQHLIDEHHDENSNTSTEFIETSNDWNAPPSNVPPLNSPSSPMTSLPSFTLMPSTSNSQLLNHQNHSTLTQPTDSSTTITTTTTTTTPNTLHPSIMVHPSQVENFLIGKQMLKVPQEFQIQFVQNLNQDMDFKELIQGATYLSEYFMVIPYDLPFQRNDANLGILHPSTTTTTLRPQESNSYTNVSNQPQNLPSLRSYLLLKVMNATKDIVVTLLI